MLETSRFLVNNNHKKNSIKNNTIIRVNVTGWLGGGGTVGTSAGTWRPALPGAVTDRPSPGGRPPAPPHAPTANLWRRHSKFVCIYIYICISVYVYVHIYIYVRMNDRRKRRKDRDRERERERGPSMRGQGESAAAAPAAPPPVPDTCRVFQLHTHIVAQK